MSSLVRYLHELHGELVQVERGGPEACQGWLTEIQTDYLTLRANDGTDLHLPLHHIRSVTPLTPPAVDQKPTSEPSQMVTFHALLQGNLGSPVRLYHAGPETTFGTLRDCADDHLILESDSGESICFALFHIRSLYVVTDQPGSTASPAAESQQGG
jgi:hypothetical protein